MCYGKMRVLLRELITGVVSRLENGIMASWKIKSASNVLY